MERRDTMPEIIDAEFVENNDPRNPCILLLDTSMSMQGARIAALNAGLQRFKQELTSDPIASRRVEVAVVTFGNNGVQVVQEFVTADLFHPPTLSANHDTPMAGAIERGLDMVAARKIQFKANGIDYTRPWVILITDGQPTDDWSTTAARVHREEKNKSIAFYAIGVQGANINILKQIAPPDRAPQELDGLKFTDFFIWLSVSQKRVSSGNGQQMSLPPTTGWAMSPD